MIARRPPCRLLAIAFLCAAPVGSRSTTANASLGIGTALAAHVFATAAELNEKAACRAVVVTAISARARAWWELLGFHPSDPDDPAQLDLYPGGIPSYLLLADVTA